jgi:hypothetical protein
MLPSSCQRRLSRVEVSQTSEEGLGLGERGVDRRRVASEFVLDRLPLHDVLVLGEIAEDVQDAEAFELSVELGFGANHVEDVRAQLVVGLKVVEHSTSWASSGSVCAREMRAPELDESRRRGQALLVGSLRFRRSVKIAPGVRFNVNKRSVGMSFGTRGARYSINSDGRRNRSVGLPGTGLYYRSQTGPRRRQRAGTSSVATTGSGKFASPARLLAHAVGVTTVVVFLFGALNGHGDFAGFAAAVGVVAYVGLRVLRPILDPLIGWILTRNTQDGPGG